MRSSKFDRRLKQAALATMVAAGLTGTGEALAGGYYPSIFRIQFHHPQLAASLADLPVTSTFVPLSPEETLGELQSAPRGAAVKVRAQIKSMYGSGTGYSSESRFSLTLYRNGSRVDDTVVTVPSNGFAWAEWTVAANTLLTSTSHVTFTVTSQSASLSRHLFVDQPVNTGKLLELCRPVDGSTTFNAADWLFNGYIYGNPTEPDNSRWPNALGIRVMAQDGVRSMPAMGDWIRNGGLPYDLDNRQFVYSRMRVSTSAADAKSTPGLRLLTQSARNVHLGEMLFQSYGPNPRGMPARTSVSSFYTFLPFYKPVLAGNGPLGSTFEYLSFDTSADSADNPNASHYLHELDTYRVHLADYLVRYGSRVASFRTFSNWTSGGMSGAYWRNDGSSLVVGLTAPSASQLVWADWTSPELGTLGSGLYLARVAVSRESGHGSAHFPDLRIKLFSTTWEAIGAATYRDNPYESDTSVLSAAPKTGKPGYYLAMFYVPPALRNNGTKFRMTVDYINNPGQTPALYRIHSADVWAVSTAGLPQ